MGSESKPRGVDRMQSEMNDLGSYQRGRVGSGFVMRMVCLSRGSRTGSQEHVQSGGVGEHGLTRGVAVENV